jgi:hypothetical protein
MYGLGFRWSHYYGLGEGLSLGFVRDFEDWGHGRIDYLGLNSSESPKPSNVAPLIETQGLVRHPSYLLYIILIHRTIARSVNSMSI